ncbi:MAG TPA: PCRF domain-containing protein [Candidatus Paceibacterota bacterium]|nr:PCRF domain-containing protein [Candidatus Paceibacterota bacterium]
MNPDNEKKEVTANSAIGAIDIRIQEIEALMQSADFWQDKEKAQTAVRELQELKAKKEGHGVFDRGGAVVNIFSGAGGDDAEDFSAMLFDMYRKYASNMGWSASLIHEHANDHGGYRNVTFELDGKNVYGTLKGESGVHRLVRVSPFNSKDQRHTSFSMVEVLPKFEKVTDFTVPESEIRIELSKAGGPGGQNVNKRETAVRAIHIPTNIAVHVTSERSQAQNKEKALQFLRGKLYKRAEEERIAKERGLSISKTTDIEWGNQIRSYVLHPYKMVKDHRTDVEVHDPEKVFNGDLEKFIEAEKNLGI